MPAALTLQQLKPHIYNICSNAAAAGTIHEISYGSIQRTLTEILDCDSQDLKPLKGDIKAYALQLLDSGPAIQDPSPSHSGSSPLPKKTQVHETPSPSPVKSAKRKRAVISSSDGEDASDKDVTNEKPKEVTPSKRRPISRPDTQKEPAGGYKSKEFLDSEDNPCSAPAEALSGDEAEQPAPRRRLIKTKTLSKKTSGSRSEGKGKKKADGEDTSPNEAEINRLKGFVKACGVRLLAKETESMDEKQTIKHLKAMLADLGMTGRLSMAKAAEIKAQRALEKEMADLIATQPRGARNRIDPDAGRGSRRRAAAETSAKNAATAKRRPVIIGDSDSEEEGIPQPEDESTEDSEESDEEDEEAARKQYEAEQRKLDKQQEKRTKQFAKLVNNSIF